MDSPRSRALIGVAALAVVVALFFILRGDDDETSTTASTTTAETTTAAETTTIDAGAQNGGQNGGQTTTPNGGGGEVATIVVKGAEPVGGVQELTFAKGDDIRFKVESDVADEIHLHGYDVSMDVEAGGSVTFDVPATIEGVFEVELEHLVVPIAEITVNPA